MPVKLNENREHIESFLNQNSIAVVSTISSHGQPSSAAVYFTLDDELNFYFITKRDTKKSKNLMNNSKAALAVYEATSQTIVQAEGEAHEETDPERTQKVFGEVLRSSLASSEAGVPPISKLQAGHYIAYKFKPTSLKMASYIRPEGGSAEQVFEMT